MYASMEIGTIVLHALRSVCEIHEPLYVAVYSRASYARVVWASHDRVTLPSLDEGSCVNEILSTVEGVRCWFLGFQCRGCSCWRHELPGRVDTEITKIKKHRFSWNHRDAVRVRPTM